MGDYTSKTKELENGRGEEKYPQLEERRPVSKKDAPRSKKHRKWRKKKRSATKTALWV